MSKKVQFDREDYLKANRKLSREEEIKTHGRPVRIGGGRDRESQPSDLFQSDTQIEKGLRPQAE